MVLEKTRPSNTSLGSGFTRGLSTAKDYKVLDSFVGGRVVGVR